MEITISNAKKADAYQIAPLIYEAIGDIAFRITGETNEINMLTKLQLLITQEDNRHSYLNTFVAKANGDVVGIIVLYDGKTGFTLDRSLEKTIFEQYGVSVRIDVEAHDEEFYIDTLCVSDKVRGQGLGTTLLRFAEQEGKRRGYKQLSLNVEEQKEKARALYEKLGFVTTEPWTIIDEPFYHMVKEI